MNSPLLLLLLSIHAPDPVQVSARLAEPEVPAGQTVAFRVDVETDGSRAQIQPFTSLPPGLELVGTRDFDQRQFSLPGGVRRFVGREFMLRAAAPGRYQIPAVRVIVDGRTYSTEPTVLTVTGAAPTPAGSPLGPDGVLVRAWLDADTVYVGEQINLHVEAVFSREARLRLRRAPEYEAPSPSGFWTHDIPDGRGPVTRGIRGDVYETQTFRRAFFPIAPGQYEIPPARLFYEMRRGVLHPPETFTAASESLPLVVLPLPEQGRPPSFTGGVGRYAIGASLEPSRVPAGEGVVLTVELTGTGNVRALPPPVLPALRDVDVFPPTEEAHAEIVGTTLRGRKTFSWILIPRRPGDLVIPPIEYAAFDPAQGAFATTSSPPLPLRVDAGALVASNGQPTTIRYVKAAPGRGAGLAWIATPWFAAAQLTPLVLLAGALLVRRRGQTGGQASAGVLRRRRRALLRDLDDQAGAGDPDFFRNADAAARAWLAARLGLDPRAADRAEALVQAGVPADAAHRMVALFERIATARYAPTAPDGEARRDLVRALGRILERIDREARGRRQARPSRVVAATGLVLGVGLVVSPAQAQAAQTRAETNGVQADFDRGVALFEASRYPEAAEAFARYVDHRPDDAAGWYNLGTARYRAGDPGHAVLAWLHGVRLDPRDRDARHNLRVAGVAPELVRAVAPVIPLRTREMLLAGAMAWLVVGVAGAWWVLRRRRTALVLATAGLVAALVLVAAALHSLRPSPIVVLLEATELRAGPNPHAETLGGLAPGTGLVAVDRTNGWTRARTPGGLEGWLETDLVGRIVIP